MPDKVLIFDTTLRDGEQSPGASMNQEEKLSIAKLLEELKVDIIEAGFPIASKGDFNSVKSIASEIKDCQIAGLARAKHEDIETAWNAVKKAKNPRIHTFIATSPIHMKFKLKLTEEEVLDKIKDSVSFARNLCSNIEWSCEDGGRSSIDFLYKCIELAIESGASTINIPDTVGYTLPFEFGEIIKKVKNNVPNIDKAIISVHCHNDLGLAVANSLNAVENGARQIECTINGLGERAGNAALEEVVMAMKVRSDLLKVQSNVNTSAISKTSKLVSSITGFPVQPNKAIVGANAFAHESGIHQDGVLKNVQTYEIMSPETIGLKKSSLVLGKHSGKHAFKEKLKILGYEVGDNYINEIFEKFKLLADKKKDVYDEDIIALVDDTHFNKSNTLKLKNLSIMSGTNSKHVASLELNFKEELKEVSGSGNGPIDAVFNCISKVVGFYPKLVLYHINAITPDSDAQGEVTVKLGYLNKEFIGKASDIDIIVASAKSYINACNKILNFEKNSNMQEGVSEISISNIKGI